MNDTNFLYPLALRTCGEPSLSHVSAEWDKNNAVFPSPRLPRVVRANRHEGVSR